MNMHFVRVYGFFRYVHRTNSFYAQFISDNNFHFLGILYELKKDLYWDQSVHMYVCNPISGTQSCYIFITFHKENKSFVKTV